MTPEQFKSSLYTAIARKNGLTEVRVGIRLEAVMSLDSNKEEDIEAAKKQGRDDVTEGVYGGRREELRRLLNDLADHEYPENEFEEEEYNVAFSELVKFQRTL